MITWMQPSLGVFGIRPNVRGTGQGTVSAAG
jgi:hypothetical protein